MDTIGVNASRVYKSRIITIVRLHNKRTLINITAQRQRIHAQGERKCHLLLSTICKIVESGTLTQSLPVPLLVSNSEAATEYLPSRSRIQ